MSGSNNGEPAVLEPMEMARPNIFWMVAHDSQELAAVQRAAITQPHVQILGVESPDVVPGKDERRRRIDEIHRHGGRLVRFEISYPSGTDLSILGEAESYQLTREALQSEASMELMLMRLHDPNLLHQIGALLVRAVHGSDPRMRFDTNQWQRI
jgi:hypothetical protein